LLLEVEVVVWTWVVEVAVVAYSQVQQNQLQQEHQSQLQWVLVELVLRQVVHHNHGDTNSQLAQQMEAIQFLAHSQQLVVDTAVVHILVTHQIPDMETLAGLVAGHQDTLMEIREEMVLEQQDKEMLEAHLLDNIIQVAVAVQVQ
jgi:hypothetical protein